MPMATGVADHCPEFPLLVLSTERSIIIHNTTLNAYQIPAAGPDRSTPTAGRTSGTNSEPTNVALLKGPTEGYGLKTWN